MFIFEYKIQVTLVVIGVWASVESAETSQLQLEHSAEQPKRNKYEQNHDRH